MSRKSRKWYPNVAIHITSRGNRKNQIFRDLMEIQSINKYNIYVAMYNVQLTILKECRCWNWSII